MPHLTTIARLDSSSISDEFEHFCGEADGMTFVLRKKAGVDPG